MALTPEQMMDLLDESLAEEEANKAERPREEVPPAVEEDPGLGDSEKASDERKAARANLVESEQVQKGLGPSEEAVPVEESKPEPAPKPEPRPKTVLAAEKEERRPAETPGVPTAQEDDGLARAKVLAPSVKEENENLVDYFATEMARDTTTDGIDFIKTEACHVEEDKDLALKKLFEGERRRLYRDRVTMYTEGKSVENPEGRGVVETLKNVPADLWHGGVLRNLKAMEDFANEMTKHRYALDFAPDVEERDSIVADLAEPIPLIAASFTPAGFVARGLQASRYGMMVYRAAAAALPRSALPTGLKMISSASFFSLFQAMKGGLKKDKDGNWVAPKHPYGAVASIVVDEKLAETKARYQDYQQKPYWGRVWDSMKGNTVDEVVLEGAVLATGAIALKGGVPLIKKGAAWTWDQAAPYTTSILRRMDPARGARLKAVKSSRKIRDLEKIAALEKEAFYQMVQNDEIPEDLLKGHLNWMAKKQYSQNLDFLNAYEEWTRLQTPGKMKVVDGNRIVEVREKPKPLFPEKTSKRDIVKPKKRALVDIQVNIGKIAGAARTSKKKLTESMDEYIRVLNDENLSPGELSTAMKALGQESRVANVEMLRLQSDLLAGKVKGKDGKAAERMIARLKKKRKTLEEVYDMTKTHAKALPDVVGEQEALERLLSHENLGQTAERFRNIPGEEREAIFDIMEKLAKGEIAPGNVKIYQTLGKGISFAKAVEVYHKTSMAGMLMITAIAKALTGNVFETGVKKGIGLEQLGVSTAKDRLKHGLGNVMRVGVARLRSKEYLNESWQMMRGVRTSASLEQRNLAYAGVQPLATPGEQALNVIPGAVFKSLEVLDEVTTAFNSPEVAEAVLFDMATRLSKTGKLTRKQAQKDMQKMIKHINEKIRAGNMKDPIVKQFLESSDEEAKRLAFRADVSKDPDAYKWIKKLSEAAQGNVSKRVDDAWHTALGKTFFQTNIFPFVNTGVNIAYRTAESLHGAGMLLSGKPFRAKGGLTVADRKRMADAAVRNTMAYGLLTYSMYADDPFFSYKPAGPGEDPAKLREAGGIRQDPDKIKLGKGLIGTDALGPTGVWLKLQAQVYNWIKHAYEEGDLEFVEMAQQVLVAPFHAAFPGQVVQNVADLYSALSDRKDAAGGRFVKRLAKQAIEKGVPAGPLVRKWKQEGSPGRLSKQDTIDYPSESFFTGDIRDAFEKGVDYLGARRRSVTGVDGDTDFDMFGVEISSFAHAAADKPYFMRALWPVGPSAAPTRDYADLEIFLSENGMFGRDDEKIETDASHPLGSQVVGNARTLTRPSMSLSIRKRTRRFLPGSNRTDIDDTQTTSVRLAPQDRNYMKSLVGSKLGLKRMNELGEAIEGSSSQDYKLFKQTFKGVERLWKDYHGELGEDGLADLMQRIARASKETIERDYAQEARAAQNDIRELGLQPNLSRSPDYKSMSEEELNEIKKIIMLDLFDEAHKLAKEIMSLHPKYQDRSPATEAEERQKSEHSIP